MQRINTRPIQILLVLAIFLICAFRAYETRNVLLIVAAVLSAILLLLDLI